MLLWVCTRGRVEWDLPIVTDDCVDIECAWARWCGEKKISERGNQEL